MTSFENEQSFTEKMEAGLGAAALLLLLTLIVFKPGYGLAMALCTPMIHPAIGPGAAFLGVAAPGTIFIGACIRALLAPGKPDQNKMCFIDFAMIAWIAYLSFSILLAESIDASIAFSGRLVYMSFSFYITTRLVCYSAGVNEVCRSFMSGMLVFGIFITVVALARQESSSEFVTRLTIGKTFIGLSIFIVLSLVNALVILFFSKSTPSKLVKLLSILGLPILTYGMFLSNTRSVVVALVLVLLFLLVRTLTAGRMDGRTTRRVVLSMLLFIGLAVVSAVSFPETWKGMGDKFILLADSAAGASDVARLELFDKAFSMFADSPVLGQGAGAYEFITGTYPHNMVLQVLADMGLIGACMLLTIVLGSLMLTLKYQSVNALYIGALLVFQLFESMVSLALWMHKNLFVFVALAVAHHLFQVAARSRGKKVKRRKPVKTNWQPSESAANLSGTS